MACVGYDSDVHMCSIKVCEQTAQPVKWPYSDELCSQQKYLPSVQIGLFLRSKVGKFIKLTTYLNLSPSLECCKHYFHILVVEVVRKHF
jgi:hypothetical protein